MVYRDDAKRERFDGDAGIVHELAHQFADRHAYLRELVQNALDAGATEVRVGIHRDGQDALVTVRDDGCGMTPAMLEEDLLTLFRSSKEGRTDAIGKFGVGFASVFAIQPSSVVVRTSRGEGVSWSLVLTPDMRYEIFESPGGSEPGTSVSLHIPLEAVRGQSLGTDEDPLEGFCNAATTSLKRWCRHVHRPVHLHLATAPAATQRVDEPFALHAVHAQVEVSVGARRIAVGLSRSGPYAGFFKRGLTLLEVYSPLLELPGLAFKVDDPTLEHTISRDDVVRNAAFAEALEQVERVAREHLGEALRTRVEALAVAEPFDAVEYEASCVALLEHAREYGVKSTEVALRRVCDDAAASPVRVQRAKNIAFAAAPSALTGALGDAGHLVLFASSEALGARLEAAFDAIPANAFTRSHPVDAQASDVELFGHVSAILVAATGRKLDLQLVQTLPTGRARDGVSAGPLLRDARLHLDEVSVDPFDAAADVSIYLDPDDALVERARRLGRRDAPFAAALLARAVLARFDRLGEGADERWLEASLETLG